MPSRSCPKVCRLYGLNTTNQTPSLRDRRFATRSRAAKPASRSGALIGLFGDIHFQDKGLNRINKAGEWIIDIFKTRNVDAVVCLGDVLNTREQVSVRALSSAMSFFDKMAEELGVPIHILLGNHDMNLKHSSKVSSLDALATKSMHKGGSFHLYRDITLADVAGTPAVMIPYYEDVNAISNALSNFSNEHDLSKSVVYGHLAVNGAIQNSSSSFRYHGALPPHLFAPVKRTFSGHFHVHQTLPNNITYVGAPLQFNFGDAGANRGIVLYDAGKDSWEFLVNPFCQQYFKFSETQLAKMMKEKPDIFKDSFVTIQYSGSRMASSHHDAIKQSLLQLGANAVFKESDIVASLKESGEQLASKLGKQQSVEEQIRVFAESVRESFAERVKKQQAAAPKKRVSKTVPASQKWEHFLLNDEMFAKLVEEGLKIVRDAKADSDSHVGGTAFDGRLARISMTNFMGIRGTIEIPLINLPRGIWLIDGDNGAGKSTMFEAIVWCQFGEFLRSGMQKDFAINDKEDFCSVTIEYENGFIIERTRKRGRAETLRTHQRTTADSAPVYQPQNELGELRNTQKLLNEKLGIDFDTFSKSVVLGQNIFTNFVSGSKEQRRTIIEEMLGLDRFNLYFEAVKQKRQDLEREMEQTQSNREAIEERIGAYQDALEEIQSEIHTAKSAKDAEAELKRRAEEKKAAYLDAIQQKKRRTLTQLETTTAKLVDFESKWRHFAADEARNISADLRVKEKHLTSLLKSSAECPSCGQQISDSHIQSLIQDCLGSIHSASDKFPTVWSRRESVSGLSECLALSRECRRALDDAVAVSQSGLEQLMSEKKQLEMDSMQVDNEILKCENQHARDTQELNTRIAAAESLLQNQESNVAKIQSALDAAKPKFDELNALLNKLEQDFNIVKFWELAFDKQSKSSTGFSTIRSFIFEDLVVELNAIIDTYAEQLSNRSPLRVTLTPDLEIEEIYGKRSGGERKRTDLAVLFSLFEIVRDRSRYRPNFLMLDEVFDALDRSGRMTVGQVLTQLAKRVDNVFIITHTDLATGMSLSGTITARMQMDGSNPAGTHFEIHAL